MKLSFREMSERTRTKSTSNKVHSKLIDKGFELVTPIPESTDPKTIPFPEWNDDEVASIFSSTSETKIREKIDKLEKNEKLEKTDKSEKDLLKFFEDPQVLFLPFCLQDAEYDWKRPTDLFPESEYQLCIYSETDDTPDLLSHSSHILHSTFMRSFISSINILEYLGNTTNFTTEFTTSKFTPNAHGPWRPWHHIYSGGKSGQGTTHNPRINPTGKYLVRLFWLGSWRRIIIDDYIPIDSTGHVLLPSLPIFPNPLSPGRTSVASSINTVGKGQKSIKGKEIKEKEKIKEKSEVEIWPFLLCKALLKLANITMNKNQELLHFNIITSLTGWVLQNFEIKAADDIWDICKTYNEMYKWKSEEEVVEEEKKPIKTKKKEQRSSSSKPIAEISKRTHYFVALCRDMRSVKGDGVEGVSPCWGHEIVIDLCRDLPLEEPPPQPEYPLWKKFRWMEWAKSRGLISNPEVLDRTRFLRCVVPLRQYNKHTIHEREKVKEFKKPIFPLRQSIALQKMSFGMDFSEYEKLLDRKKSSSKLDITKIKEKKRNSEHPIVDPSFWVKFDDISRYLQRIMIFFKPSELEHKSRISDLKLNEISTQKAKSKVTLKEPNALNNNDIKWTKDIQEKRNEPLYFFTDSLQCKIILINFSQAGDTERLTPLNDKLSDDNFFVEYEKLFGDKSKPNAGEPPPPRKLKINRPKIHASLKSSNLLLDTYLWDEARTDEIATFLNSYGNTSTLFELAEGRHVFRLWIKSEFSFCITILSDTHFTIGYGEHIVESMALEPKQITQLSLNISKCFATLVNNFGNQEFSKSLKDYYRSYMPFESEKKLTKLQKDSIHMAFKESLQNYLEQSLDSTSLQKCLEALKTLFLDTSFKEKKLFISVIVPDIESFQFQSILEKIMCEKSSTKIKAFLKGVIIRKLKLCHGMSSKEHEIIYDILKSIYHEIFSPDNRDECFGEIMRNFFHHKYLINYVDLYKVSKDFKWDVRVESFSGTSELTKDFVVLCRYVLYFTAEKKLRIHLFCSVPNFVMRVINNDNNEEIYRFTNETFPTKFAPNNYGYTVIGFAWSQENQDVLWKLVIISERKLITPYTIEELKSTPYANFENYVPTSKSLIGKHIITIKENVLLSLRFSCSYENVKFNIKLYSPSQSLLLDIYGTEKIIIPSILLKYTCTADMFNQKQITRNRLKSKLYLKSSFEIPKKENSKTKKLPSSKKIKEQSFDVVSEDQDIITYYFEIYVVNDSWPLTMKEWHNVKALRESTYYTNKQKSDVNSLHIKESRNTPKSLKSARKSFFKKQVERPWYLLQYVLETHSPTNFIRDKKEEEELYSVKKSWYEDHAERYQISSDLRNEYLARYTDPGCECPEEYNIKISFSLTSSISDKTQSSQFSEEIDDTVRINNCPKWTNADIPPFNLTPFYRPECPCPLDIRRRYIKRHEDLEADDEQAGQFIEEYNASLLKSKEDLEFWIDETKERKVLLFLWYGDCRKMSQEIMQNYYVERQNFIDKSHTKMKLEEPKTPKTPKKPKKKK